MSLSDRFSSRANRTAATYATVLILIEVGSELDEAMDIADWFLEPDERENEDTCLDRRHPDGRAWTSGNEVAALVHGRVYFAELLRCLALIGRGDLVLFADWRGDPDQALDGSGVHVSRALCEAAGGECLLDQRVRPGGSHHQKFVVLRHPARPDLDVAFVGGIDLCHSRRDDAEHHGDEQKQPMAAVYGDRPPWHDMQLAIRGPAVADVEATFRERWQDPSPLTRNPINVISERVRRDDRRPGRLPDPLPDPEPTGAVNVQLLRTYGNRHPGYPFAPRGERSVAHAYNKVVPRAQSLIYIEDQYLWSAEIVACFTDSLRNNPGLHLIAVIPHHPDQDGRFSMPPNLVGRQHAMDELHNAAPDRVAVYGIENRAGTPVYVHAKVCVIDDVWAAVGSDNINRRSWTHDSELSCAIVDDVRDDRAPLIVDRFSHGARRFARNLRLELAREHLDRADNNDTDLIDPATMFARFTDSAAQLQRWHDHGRSGPRPRGRLRPYNAARLSRRTLAWATPLYRTVYDPDGRPLTLRYRHRF